jgi:hypothetical protein
MANCIFQPLRQATPRLIADPTERSPAESAIRQAVTFRAIVAIAAPMDSHAKLAGVSRAITDEAIEQTDELPEGLL